MPIFTEVESTLPKESDWELDFYSRPIIEPDGIKTLEMQGAKEAIRYLIEHLSQNPWNGIDTNEAKDLLSKSADSAGVKKGLVMKSLRAALLGRMQGPDLMATWSLLARIGQDSIRLRSCL